MEVCENYAEIFREGLYHKFGWYGRPENQEKAFRYFEWLSRFHYVPALLEVGCCYLEGRGVEKDQESATYYFLDAKHQGSSTAANLLGNCFLNGTGVHIDIYEAIACQNDSTEMVNGDEFQFLSLYLS